ncbi:uncharacterized protein [Diadema antillarum]|uniref:uncharacterized protein n=1 Tax=Diadema antillarum TaxID=105358 RepID=UPI003A844987
MAAELDRPEETRSIEKLGFAVQFAPTFGYVANVESAERVRREYELVTGTKFSTYRQSKDFGKEGFAMAHHKICWEDSAKLRQGHIAFDHVPYIVIGIKMLDCKHGRDRHLAKKRRSLEAISNEPDDSSQQGKQKRKRTVGTKLDCPAQITFRDILKFPGYAISADSVWRRKTTSEKLRKNLASGVPVQRERRIYVKFPSKDEHQGHDLASIPGRRSQEEDKVLVKIEMLVQEASAIPNVQSHLQGVMEEESGVNTQVQSEEGGGQSEEGRAGLGAEGMGGAQVVSGRGQSGDEPGRVEEQGTEQGTPGLGIIEEYEAERDRMLRGGADPCVQRQRESVEGVARQNTPAVTPCSADCGNRCPREDTPQPQIPISQAEGDPALVPPTPAPSRAAKCRNILQHLISQTYVIQEVSILDQLCEQLTAVKMSVDAAMQQEEQHISLEQMLKDNSCCEDEEECCGDVQEQSKEDVDARRRLENTENPSGCGARCNMKKLPKTTVAELSADSRKPLSDVTVLLAQNLIQEKFPSVHGFEDPALGRHLLFSAAQGEFGQLMQDGNHHWVFVSSIGCTTGVVKYYDGLGARTIPDLIRKQIARVVCSQETEIIVDVQSVQSCPNVFDSGLFAIAYAVSTLHQEDLGQVSYNVTLMRDHLLQCLQEKSIRPFPAASERVSVQRTRQRFLSMEVFCMCRMPWNANMQESRMKMAQCESCGEWWHSNCCGIPDEVFTSNQPWKCPRCEDVHSAVAALNSLQAAVFPEAVSSSTTITH